MSAPCRFMLLGASHKTAALAVREKLAVDPARIGEFYAGLRAVPGVQEAVLLSTCNRLEVYALLTPSAQETALEQFVCTFQSFPPAEFLTHRFVAHAHEAVQHLVEVAVGADSQIVGEVEILGQVKQAYATATAANGTGPVLHRVFQKAFHAAKHIRTTTPIGEGQVNIATVAVDLARKVFGELDRCRVLVIGTGEVGEKTMKALQSRGATSITVLSRFMERAEALAGTVGAQFGTLDRIAALLPAHDVVIGCTNSPQPVVSSALVRAAQRSRRLRPLFLIDLAVPRNFEAAASQLDSVFLYDLDDLVRIADENLAARRSKVSRARQLAQERALSIWNGVLPRLPRVTPTALTRDSFSAQEPAT